MLDERLRTVPAAEVHTIHSDPTDPHAYLGEARLLSGLDPAALAALPDLAGPASPAPSVVEVRHLGGALARSTTQPAAHRDARYLLRAVTALDGTSEATARAAQDRIVAPSAARDLGRAGTFAYGR